MVLINLLPWKVLLQCHVCVCVCFVIAQVFPWVPISICIGEAGMTQGFDKTDDGGETKLAAVCKQILLVLSAQPMTVR